MSLSRRLSAVGLFPRRPSLPGSAAGLRLALLVAPALLLACGGEEAGLPGSRAGRPVPVSVAPVERRDVPVQLEAIGTVEAFSTVELKPQVEGKISRVLFQEGQSVAQGDLLFEIDSRPFETKLREAQANLEQARAEAKLAELELGRLQRLMHEKVVSPDDLDRAKAKAESMDAAVTADQAAADHAELDVQYCSIRSPIDGRIGQILVDEGNVVKANETELAVIHQTRPVRVSFAVPQQDLPDVREQMAAHPLEVEAILPGHEAQPVTGTLAFIDNAIDEQTGTVLLKGIFANRDESLWPGEFVSVQLTLSTRKQVLTVPARAIQTGQKGTYVFVVGENDVAETRPVVTAFAAGDQTVVSKGLEAGERVVTDGQIRLASGVPVRIVASAPESSPGAPAAAGGLAAERAS